LFTTFFFKLFTAVHFSSQKFFLSFARYFFKKKLNTTKADLIIQVANGTGITKLETEAIIDGFIETIKETLIRGNNIEIRGFGSFKVVLRKPRIGRNPKTGVAVPIDENYTPFFKVSKEFKTAVNSGLMKKIKKVNR
jgi:DNA-binding protein HU-beta